MEPPDPLEKRIRFGCGFVFGLLVGAGLTRLLSLVNVGGYYGLALLVTAGVVFGWVAMKYGDDFWFALSEWFWWRW